MATLKDLVELGKELGYEGTDLQKFVAEQQEKEREERRKERELQREKEEQELEEKERERRHELEMKKLELQERERQSPLNSSATESTSGRSIPKLPVFDDSKDEIDSYLQRFERFAQNQKWERAEWATYLSALLSGPALEVYSRMGHEDAQDYDRLKKQLLQRYDLTDNGYRAKFRSARPLQNESPRQLLIRLCDYFDKWLELSELPQDLEGARTLIVKEQFLRACPRELEVYLSEQSSIITNNFDELAQIAERYMQAHRIAFFQNKDKPRPTLNKDAIKKCFKCDSPTHLATECPAVIKPAKKWCRYCKRDSHDLAECSKKPTNWKNDAPLRQVAAISELQESPSVDKDQDREIIEVNGKKYMEVACCGRAESISEGLKTVKGLVNDNLVDVLRDSGCSIVVIRRSLLRPDQFTGKHGIVVLADNSVIKLPEAKVTVDTPYFQGEVIAMAMEKPIRDLLIGNIRGARSPGDPDPEWNHSAAAITRAQSAKERQPIAPLTMRSNKADTIGMSKTHLQELQRDDPTINRCWQGQGKEQKGPYDTDFIVKKGILYRRFQHDGYNFGEPINQLVVPRELREQVMRVAHDSIMAGHLGIKKTTDRIQRQFFWPGMRGDINRYCRSCDVCQKTVKRGTIPKAPLGRMPLIDVPFKRCAVDLIGPISPPSEGGHQFILTLVDYATRYPEAIPLKKTTTEEVAEALLNIFSRVGIPDEILSDMGTQFTSDLMKEISRLLQVRQLTTTPYHPQCNGLVERFNGTLKTMLRRLCTENPRQWHRYINAALFAYREVPQESTGFSPFELLYGRSIKGPMSVLKRLWTDEEEDTEIKNSYRYVLELREKLDEMTRAAQESLGKSLNRQKLYFDQRTRERKFEVNEKVLVLLPTEANKLLMQWKGPFVVTKALGSNNYLIQMGNKTKTFHANLLKRYFDRGEEDTNPERSSAAEVRSEAASADVEDDDEQSQNEELDVPSLDRESAEQLRYGKELNEMECHEVRELIHGYEEIFTDRPGTTSVMTHCIELTSQEPIRLRPYPIPFSLREKLRANIAEMMELGIIRKSTSPYSAPIVLVPKPDGSSRLCVDYRKLNKITISDPEPMVTSMDVFQKLGGDRYFSKIDLSKGYWQIPVREQDIQKTAFATPDGLYEFLKMPFGMTNAGATFVRAMRRVLEGLIGVESYIDDILLHSATWEEHLKILKSVLERLKIYGLTARPSKCIIGTTSLEFIGHHISPGKISPTNDNLEKIRQSPRPTTKQQIRSFIGLTGFYREYVPNYAAIASPLTDLTKKGAPNRVYWTEAQEKAYRTLLNAVLSRPVLQLPDFGKPFILRTDASDTGLGAILLQAHEDKLFPVSYASRKLLPRESRYSTIEKECLAVVWAVKRFELFLYGRPFTLQTDHQPLLYIDRSKFDNKRIMRWAMFLQEYQIHVESIKGKDNIGADYLSRLRSDSLDS